MALYRLSDGGGRDRDDHDEGGRDGGGRDLDTAGDRITATAAVWGVADDRRGTRAGSIGANDDRIPIVVWIARTRGWLYPLGPRLGPPTRIKS